MLKTDRLICDMCGDCCKGLSKARIINVFPSDIKRIASFLNMSVGNFRRKYTYSDTFKSEKKTYKLNYLIDVNGVCVFLNRKNLCTIHIVKPVQCLLWPEIIHLKKVKEVRKYPCVNYEKMQRPTKIIDNRFIDEILLEER